MASELNELTPALAPIRLLAFDVDGVLTDGRLVLSSAGEESKAFNVRDGLGIVLAQRVGLKIAFISGRQSPAVDRRAAELGLPDDLNLHSVRDKSRALVGLRERRSLDKEQVAFAGDDLNDLLAFQEAGFAAAVADASAEMKAQAHYVARLPGGGGAAREIIELILKAQGKWEEGVQAYLDYLKRPSVIGGQ